MIFKLIDPTIARYGASHTSPMMSATGASTIDNQYKLSNRYHSQILPDFSGISSLPAKRD